MHETTRRLICRCGFVALCLLPTVTVIAVVAAFRLPAHRVAWEARLSERLGLGVSIARVSHPRPGATLLEGVRLADPETGQSIARLRLLETARVEGTQVILVSQPEIDLRHLGRLWRAFESRLLQSENARSLRVQLTAGELTLRGDEYAQTLTDVRGGIEPVRGGTQASLSFVLAGSDMRERAEVRATRLRRENPPRTRLELHTGDAALPCATAVAAWPWLARLGPRCRFRGVVRAESAGGAWQGELTGRLSEVDLDRTVSDQFPHKLSGAAEVVIRRAKMRGGQMEEFAGAISAGPGVVSRSLITSLADSLRLVYAPAGDDDGAALLSYRQLAVGFSLDGAGLLLAGQCDGAPPGTILVDERGGRLDEGAGGRRPGVALVRALVPDNQVQVPATRQTEALLRALPLPSVVVRPGSRLPRPQVRFSGEIRR